MRKLCYLTLTISVILEYGRTVEYGYATSYCLIIMIILIPRDKLLVKLKVQVKVVVDSNHRPWFEFTSFFSYMHQNITIYCI